MRTIARLLVCAGIGLFIFACLGPFRRAASAGATPFRPAPHSFGERALFSQRLPDQHLATSAVVAAAAPATRLPATAVPATRSPAAAPPRMHSPPGRTAGAKERNVSSHRRMHKKESARMKSAGAMARKTSGKLRAHPAVLEQSGPSPWFALSSRTQAVHLLLSRFCLGQGQLRQLVRAWAARARGAPRESPRRRVIGAYPA